MIGACRGVTRNGRPCSLTSASTLVDNQGRSVASPLSRGGQYCLFHSRPFASHPVANPPKCLVILIIDLETTGVDVTRDRIVEFSAVQACPTGQGACFSTVVKVDSDVMSTPGARSAANIHGIHDDEILENHLFPECWLRFTAFVEGLLNDFVYDDSETSDEELPNMPRPPNEPPTLLLAAHNGCAFDFAALLCECYRNDFDLSIFDRWLYVDTLRVVKTASLRIAPCLKLQCMTHHFCSFGDLKAHRARDDCVALLGVLRHFAESLGITVDGLLRMFAEVIDLEESIAQISTLVILPT